MELASLQNLKSYKETLKLSSIQRDFLIGTILGDGNLRFMGRSTEASLTVDHSLRQRDYVLWKYQLMENLVLTEPKELNRIYHKDRSQTLKSLRFQTISHPEFTSLYNIFYRNGIKIIPLNIRNILRSPFSLAVWFMDDGNKNRNTVFLNTQQFGIAEQKVLMNCLKDNFELETTLNKHWLFKGKQFYRIRIVTKSMKRFYDLINDYLLTSMLYKIPFIPVTTSPI